MTDASLIIDNSFVEGNIKASGIYAGGLVGEIYQMNENNTDVERTIKNSYFYGNVCAESRAAGGITGLNYNNSILNIENCSVIGNITARKDAGAIVGANANNSTINIHGSTISKNLQGLPTYSKWNNNVSENVEPLKISDKRPNQEIELQVGLNEFDSSQITIDTKFSLYGIRILKLIGKNDTIDFLSKIDKFNEILNSKQTEYGSAQNRLESALNEIETSITNLTSHRSTLKDTDVAHESSQFIKNQILQQASATLLATANQTPAIALQLI